MADQIAACRHANGKYWWIMAHEVLSDTFIQFLITDKEVIGPIYQKIGSVPPPLAIGNIYHWAGEMFFSPNGEKLVSLASNMNAADLFDFDRCSGVLSNYINLSKGINNKSQTGYGFTSGAFSPNSQRLYISKFDSLFQFDLTQPSVMETRVHVENEDSPNYGIAQLAPDGKIYYASVTTVGKKYLTAIHQPDLPFPDCQLDAKGLYLGGKTVLCGLPNLPEYNLSSMIGKVAFASQDTSLCKGDSARLQALQTDASHSYGWYVKDVFLDSATTLFVTPDTTTIYTLKVRDPDHKNECEEALDFVIVHIIPDTVAPCTTLARSPMKETNRFAFYPNPADQSIHIQFKTAFSKNFTVVFYNVLGKEVDHQEVNTSDVIDVSKWSPGIYLCKVFDGEKLVGQGKVMVVTD